MTGKKWLQRGLAIGLSAAMCFSFAPTDNLVGISEVFAEEAEETENLLTNGDFETVGANNREAPGWSISLVNSEETAWGTCKQGSNAWATNNTTTYVELSNYDNGVAVNASAVQTVALSAGTYTASIQSAGNNEGSEASVLALTATSGESILASDSITLGGWDAWTTTTITFTLEDEADVTIGVTGTLADSSYCDLDNAALMLTSSAEEEPAEMVEITLPNGDFETGDTTNWVMEGFSQVTTDTWATVNTSNRLSLWLSETEAVEGSASYTVNLTEGTYQFSFEVSGDVGSGLGYRVMDSAGNSLDAGPAECTSGWDKWNTYSTNQITLTEDTEITFVLSGIVAAGAWGYLDNLKLYGTGGIASDEAASDEATPVEAAINVDKVVDLTEDFIMGMDISSVMSEFASGVTYKDFDGKIIDNITDFCKFLKTCGVTTIRVRVWNDPTDSDGNSYGGGANDLATAVEIAEGCAAAGLDMLIDFHCSDFWTDPSKQQAPKAWKTYTLEEKKAALADFITDSLTQIKNTGAKISMVQVGNETTSGFIGEKDVANMCALFNAGSAAIRKVDENIKVVIHVTNPEKSNMTTWAENLANYGVNYDVLATSYYPSWHGTFANLKSQLETVKNTYGKDVMVAETSYAYTLEDTDGHENTILEGSKNAVMECETQYPFSAQGQASFLRDLINTVNEAGGLGVFYWEPAWITVGDTTGLSGEEYDAQVAANKKLWEENGSGWASSYAGDYDPDDAGVWYGGSAVDNQALFTADGSPLASINVWKYVRTGAYTNSVSVESIASAEETVEEGDSYYLPDTLTVTYNKGAAEEAVSWEEADVAKIDTSVIGTYVVNGTVTFSKEVNDGTYSGQESAAVTYTLTVKAKNLIGADWSFENGGSNFDGLDVNGTEIKWTTDDSLDGTYALHWWLASGGNSAVTYLGKEKSGITLAPGTYTFEAQTQGVAGDTVALSILEHGTDSVLAVGDAVTLNGWKNWLVPTVSFEVTSETTIDLQMNVGIQAGGWGTIDCMYLYRTSDVETADEKDPADGEDPADAKKPTANKTTSSSTTTSNTALVVIEDESVPIAGIGTEDVSDETTSAAGNEETAAASGTVTAAADAAGTEVAAKTTDRNITVTADESEEADEASEENTDDSINPDEADGDADAGLTDDAGTTAIADEEAPLSATAEKSTFHWYWLLLLAAVAAVIGKLGYEYKKKTIVK